MIYQLSNWFKIDSLFWILFRPPNIVNTPGLSVFSISATGLEIFFLLLKSSFLYNKNLRTPFSDPIRLREGFLDPTHENTHKNRPLGHSNTRKKNFAIFFCLNLQIRAKISISAPWIGFFGGEIPPLFWIESDKRYEKNLIFSSDRPASASELPKYDNLN